MLDYLCGQKFIEHADLDKRHHQVAPSQIGVGPVVSIRNNLVQDEVGDALVILAKWREESLRQGGRRQGVESLTASSGVACIPGDQFQ